ncbi:MAG TPA: universal stress protein [Planctomycetota bacterium]|nr:universal stress protein [Planctomycetota bacterium]
MRNPSILVPIDFSELSRNALRAGDQLAAALGGHVVPMHAYEPLTSLEGFSFHGPDGTVSGDFSVVTAEIERAMQTFAARDVDVTRLRPGRFVSGQAARAIAEVAVDFDLVVISSHGRSGFSRMLLGSVTDRVLRLTTSPVLVVYGKPTLDPLQHIVVPTDLSANSSAVLPVVQALAQASGATVDLLHVHIAGEAPVSTAQLEDRVRDFATNHASVDTTGWTTTILVASGTVEDVLSQHLQDDPANLVVMATHGVRSGPSTLLGRAPASVVRNVRTAALLVTPASARAARLSETKA